MRHTKQTSAAIGSTGWRGGDRTWNRARGRAMRSPVVSVCVRPSDERSLAALSVDEIRDFVAELAETVEGAR